MKSAVKSSIIVEFSTNDPELAAILQNIASYPDTSSCRHELEASLYGFLHDKAIRDAEQWKRIEQNQADRQERQIARKLKKGIENGNSN